MYNRYVPQPDGTYRKKKMAEPNRRPQPKPPIQTPVQKEERPVPVCPQETPPPPKSPKKAQPFKQESLTSFFTQLLPKDLDTADLLIIILLLLMAGDCEESKSNALLTLALYFFL